jgi:hypothetical protein
MIPEPSYSLQERLERIEQRLENFQGDWDRDMSIVIEALRVIGKALDVKLALERLVEKLDDRVP